MGSKFGIFRGFGWVCSSILVDEPGFTRVRKFDVSRFGPGSGPFLAEHVRSSGFLEGFKVQFWWRNLGSSEFEVQHIKFEGV